MALTTINGLILKKMIIAGANEMNRNKQLVDSLNVFPVPDGDTGTNMSLTVLAAAREVEKTNTLNAGEVARLAANGSLRGARGNSGVILSQLFRGFSKGLDEEEELDVLLLSKAARNSVETAYKAVMKPKEGTILTVARACAESAEKYCETTEDIEEFIGKILEDAREVLLQTKEMLPVLKQANVVDAGGKGLLCILEGAFSNINNKNDIKLEEISLSDFVDSFALASVDNESITFGYCTEFIVNTSVIHESIVNKLKSFLNSIGDSIVVVHDDEIIKVHVHTDHPGLVIEKALKIGSLSGLKIDNMREQHTNKIDFGKKENGVSGNKPEEAVQIEEKETGFISISMGSGLSNIFTKLGCDVIIEGGQTMNPSTEDILNAIERINSKNIIILPNNKNIILAAVQAAKLADGKNVYVLPTKTIPEGFAAMFSFEGANNLDEAIEAMTESIKTVKTAMVTYAVRNSEYSDKSISEGDILGMINGDIQVVAKDIFEGTKEILNKAISDENDMVSIYYGSDVTEDDAKAVEEYINNNYPDCEVEVHFGGQPLYYYIISVE